MSAGEGRRPRALRLFYALWPGEAWRSALASAAAPALAQVAGQPVPPGNLHVTLVFLGSVPGRHLSSLIEVGGLGAWPSVELEFRRLEYWAKPRVVVAIPVAVPEAGRAIVDRLWQALAQLGFERERRPWQPHLTLVRRVRRPPAENLALEPIAAAGAGPDWRLALVESSAHPDGVRYRPLADWPLHQERTSPSRKGERPR